MKSCWPTPESWHRFWPAKITAAIAVIQLLVSFALVTIHAAIAGIGIAVFCWGAGNWVIMGFVCWAIFLACWISIFCVTCCNRSSPGCATYSMIKNILAFIFAAILIDFDQKFLNKQSISSVIVIDTTCIRNYDLSNSASYHNYVELRKAVDGLAKGQLAGSVVILISALVFIAVYIYVFIRTWQDNGSVSGSVPFPRQFVNGSAYIPSGYHQPQPIPMTPNRPGPIYSSHTVVCDNCGTAVPVPERF